MHTAQLKKDYPEVYREFFNTYDLVVSAPIIDLTSWVNSSFTHGNSGHLYFKFPLRNYIWINTHDKIWKVDFWHKLNSESNFVKESFFDHYESSKDIFQKMGLDFGAGFLSEYHWHDYPSIAWVAATAQLLLRGDLDFSSIHKLNINDDYHEHLDKIISQDRTNLSNGFLSSMRNNSSTLAHSLLATKSHTLLIEKNWMYKIYDMGDGLSYETANYSNYVINPNVYKKSFIQSGDFDHVNQDVRHFALKTWIDLWKADYIDGMDIISQHLAVESYKDLQELYWNSKRSKAFFNNYFLSNFPLYFVYRDSFERRLNENFLEKIGILQKSKDSQWCWDQDGGRILIHGDRSFDLTQESIKELNHWSAYYLTLDYSSRLDGFETGWVRVEQYRSQGVFSEFLSPYSLSVHSNKNNEQTLFWEYEILSSHVGLIIDPELKKVFLNGKALTSKDLPTQKTLVDVLVLLFLNKQSSIRNTDLPLSSYSKNKNDFVGKVISPIHWLLRECGFTGTLLSTRGTNSDFQIMAGMRDFEMGFLQGRS